MATSLTPDLILSEAALVLGVTTSTLRAQANKDRLATRKRGRALFVVRAEVERYAREEQGKLPDSKQLVVDVGSTTQPARGPDALGLRPSAEAVTQRLHDALVAVEELRDAGPLTDLESELVRSAKEFRTRVASTVRCSASLLGERSRPTTSMRRGRAPAG
jgi:hypothetical protein